MSVRAHCMASGEGDPLATGGIQVEIAYCGGPDAQTVIALVVPASSTVGDVFRLSGIQARHPELDPGQTPFGIFGQRVTAAHRVTRDDRVECYRPLRKNPRLTNPRLTRRTRVGR